MDISDPYDLKLLADAMRRRAMTARTGALEARGQDRDRLLEEADYCAARAAEVEAEGKRLSHEAARRLVERFGALARGYDPGPDDVG